MPLYDGAMAAPWVRELRRLHDENFHWDWKGHVGSLNRELGLDGPNELGLPAPELPPPWFVGDVESLQAHEWALVVSLNQARREEDEEYHRGQHHTEQTYWDYWRRLNLDHWNPRFYRPFVRLASQAIGVAAEREAEPQFATTRMMFIELCPYSSRAFELPDEVLHRLVTEDRGFRIAERVRHILIGVARPAVVLVNGVPAIEAFERSHGDQLELGNRLGYPSCNRAGKTLWHREGHLNTGKLRVPVVAFPFLRKPHTHNAYSEIDQLGAMARQLIQTLGS